VPVDIYEDVFYEVDQSACTLEVPMGSVSAYKEADVWKEFNIVGIDVGVETLETDVVKTYPNPTTGELHVTSDALHVTNVEIFDIYGRKPISDIRLSDYPTSDIKKSDIGKSEIQINIAHLPAGIYFLKISTDAGAQTQKIIKL
jgi:hypothetical protein